MEKAIAKTTEGQLEQISSQKFLKDWALALVEEKYSSCTDIATCLKSNTPSIGYMKRIYGNDFAKSYIMTWIINLRMFVNVGNAMTDEQTRMTAQMIVQEYVHITIADINLIFRNAKLGRYGEFYGRLDGQMILSWFDKYFDERCNVASEQSISEAQSMRGRDHDTPQRVQKIIESVIPKK